MPRALVIITLAAAFAAYAQTDLQATVTGIEGNVRVRTDETGPWREVQVGAQLGMGAEIRTGLRSAVQFTIPPSQTVTIDRLGVVKLLTAVQAADGKLKTDLGMKYGRTRYQIEAAGLEHDTRIKTPSIALTVRGTEVGVQQDFVGLAWCNTHRAFFNGNGRSEVMFGAPTEVTETYRRPVDYRLTRDLTDPKDRNARADPERRLLIEHPEGTLGLHQNALGDFRELFALSSGGNTSEFNVFFDLSWDPINGGQAADDLNLFVLYDPQSPALDSVLLADSLIIDPGLPAAILNALPPVQTSAVGEVLLTGDGGVSLGAVGFSTREIIALNNPTTGTATYGVQMVAQSGAAPNNTNITLTVTETLDNVAINNPLPRTVNDLTRVGEVGPLNPGGPIIVIPGGPATPLPVHAIIPP